MPITVVCECGHQVIAKDEFVGRRTQCPSCGKELLISPALNDAFGGESFPSSPGGKQGMGVPGERYDLRDAGTSGKAIASLVSGLFSCICLPGIVGVVLGVLALTDISKSRGRLQGMGVAISGIALNCVGMLVSLPLILFGSALILPVAMWPAVQSARAAAQRAQCMNDMKQIGLALHNHAAAEDRFPAAAIVDKDGKPLLSWRVKILPFIGEEPLYKQFHLDEPWDSPNNKPLLARMPQIYACPTDSKTIPASNGRTNYLAVTGPHTIFDGPEGVKVSAITDGTSNTFLVCEAMKAVPWTKPEDIVMPENQPPAGLGGTHGGEFNALFADGAIRNLKNDTPASVLRAYATRDGKETVPRP